MNRVIRWSCGVWFAFMLGGAAHADPLLPTIPATNFNITSFGAFGNGLSNNATAIQNTINAASAAGGGTVVVASVVDGVRRDAEIGGDGEFGAVVENAAQDLQFTRG